MSEMRNRASAADAGADRAAPARTRRSRRQGTEQRSFERPLIRGKWGDALSDTRHSRTRFAASRARDGCSETSSEEYAHRIRPECGLPTSFNSLELILRRNGSAGLGFDGSAPHFLIPS